MSNAAAKFLMLAICLTFTLGARADEPAFSFELVLRNLRRQGEI